MLILIAAGLYVLVATATILRHRSRTQRVLEHALVMARLRAYHV
jgi:hypothetical protein